MDRISTTNKAVDLFGAGKHGFKDGDLALGIAPTELNAAWFNGVQEELMAIIEAAGIVPSAGTRNQILTALRSAGVHQTPAQFDNSTQAATSAFVKRQGLQLADYIGYTTNTVLAASVAGKVVTLNGNGVTLTLPLISSVPVGATITFHPAGASGTVIQRQSADQIYTGAGFVNSIALAAGDSVTLLATGSAWLPIGGSGQIPYSSQFGSSLAANGYQKLPSGLIIQWGAISKTTTATPLAVTFPISFPTACRCVVPSIGGAATPNGGAVSAGSFTASGFDAHTTTGAAGMSINWMAVGH